MLQVLKRSKVTFAGQLNKGQGRVKKKKEGHVMSVLSVCGYIYIYIYIYIKVLNTI